DNSRTPLVSPTVSTSGTYKIVATDATSGCTTTKTVTVTLKPSPIFTATSPTLACGVTSFDLSTAISGAGGTYTYAYQDNSGNPLGSPTVSTSGTYKIVATDGTSGCTITKTVTVTLKPSPTFTATSPTLACGVASFDLSTAISGAGGTYTYAYQDNSGNPLGSPTVSTSGTYKIVATDGTSGCTTTKTV